MGGGESGSTSAHVGSYNDAINVKRNESWLVIHNLLGGINSEGAKLLNLYRSLAKLVEAPILFSCGGPEVYAPAQRGSSWGCMTLASPHALTLRRTLDRHRALMYLAA